MRVTISVTARKRLFSLPHSIIDRVVEKIDFFAKQTDPLLFSKHIGGKIYRFRVGDYRILFEISDEAINIVKIERRDKAYE